MLVELKTQNCLSYQGMTRFSMVGVDAYQEHERGTVLGRFHDRKILKSVFVFGANASGKSNLIEVFGHMKRLVGDSFKRLSEPRAAPGPPLPIQFRLHTQSLLQPTLMEASFLVGPTLYRYGFEIDGATVVKEWLYQTAAREVALFTREGDRVKIHRTLFKEGAGLTGQVQSDVLFLARVGHAGGRIACAVAQWFHRIGIVNAVKEPCYRSFTMDLLEIDPAFRAWATEFLAYLGIVRLSVAAEEQAPGYSSLGANLSPLLRETLRAYSGDYADRKAVIAWHHRYDDAGQVVGEVPFSFDKEESSGTRRLLYLLGPIYDTLRNGKLLLLDELDAQLHPLLLQRIVELFHAHNRKRAQFVVVSHGTALLSMGGMRRDQVWFVEKDPLGASTLYSLLDLEHGDTPGTSHFGRHYLAGKYGAIPVFREA